MLEVLLLVVGGAIGAAIGATVVRWRNLERRRESERERLALREDLHATQTKLAHYEKRLALRGDKIVEVEKQRDDYARIASTHEVTQHQWRSGQWIRKVWKDRRYSGH